jgi:hypothetical protein
MWYDGKTGAFRYATEMRCVDDAFYVKKVAVTYFTDDLCSKIDLAQPGGTYPSPHIEDDGHFTDTLLECSNMVATWNCENEYRVGLRGTASEVCHGGCGLIVNGEYRAEDCEPFGVDPVPPSGGQLICEKWYNANTGFFEFATELDCFEQYVNVVYYLDEACSVRDPNQPSGTYISPYQNPNGYFKGQFFECSSSETWLCENEFRVGLRTDVDARTCHGDPNPEPLSEY